MKTEKEIKMRDLPDYGDHMTLEEWISNVKCGGFIDYDGFGYLATETQESNIVIHPSDLQYMEGLFDPKFTHVMWYNK